MAVYVLTIDGTPRPLQEGSVDIRETTNSRNLLNCAIASLDGTYRPDLRDEVILTEDGTRIFGGNIDIPSEQGVGRGANGSGPQIITTVSASDFNALADRRQVTEEIPAGTLEAALLVIEPYLTDYGVTLDGSQATGPSLPALSYVSRKLTEVLDELSALTNYEWTWEIDYNKILRMREIGTAAAPFNVTDTNATVEGDITVEPTTTDYANYIILLAGSGLKEVTDDFVGDGVTTNFPLNYTLASDRGYVTNGAGNETLGPGATWSYDPVTNSITRTSAPANLNAISITYTAQFPMRLTADGGAAPADLVEKTYVNDAIFDRTVGQALADALLARDSATPKQVRYRTAQDGIHPGQVQTITSTKRNLSGDFLITDVQIQTIAGHILRRNVTAVSGGVIPASWREVIKQWSGSSGAAAAAASVTIITSGGVGGTGTTGKIPLWSGTATISDSNMAQTAGLITVTGALTATTTITATTFSGSGASLTSIPETAITDGAILARVAATETISGAWTFTTTPFISAAEPALAFRETDQGTDLKVWRFDINGAVFQLQTLNDAASSVVATVLTINRSGAFAVLGGITAGSGAVGIVDSTGKIPAISSTYFASLSAANLTSIPAGQLTGTITSTVQDTITRTGALDSGSITSGFGTINIGADGITAGSFTGSGTGLTGVDLLASVNTHTLAGLHTWTGATNGAQRLVVVNTTSNTAAQSGFRADAGSTILVIAAFSQGYTTAGTAIASSASIESSGAAGLSLVAASGTGDVRIYSRNTLAATWGASQALALTGAADVAGAFSVATNKFTVAAASGNTAIAGTLVTVGIGTFSAGMLPFTNYVGDVGATSMKFRQAHIGELVVETLVAQNTAATIGGRILVAPTNILTADLAPATTTITVKYNNFANGDRIRLEAENKLEWMAITSVAGGSAGAYTYTVTRNLDGTGANQWYAGDAALDTGTTGNGFIDLYSQSGVLSGTGPTIVGNVRTGTTYSDIAVRWAIGNLDGLYGYSGSTYGAAFGDPSNAWIKIDTTNGIRIGHNATTKIQLDASGNASFTGTVTAAAGAIGGWTIGADYIRDTAGVVGLSSAVTGGDDIRFWAGDATMANAEFRVTEAGALFASDVTLVSAGAYNSATAFKFARTSGFTGGINAFYCIGASTIQNLVIENTSIPTTNTTNVSADVQLSAIGWNGSTMAAANQAGLTLSSGSSVGGSNVSIAIIAADSVRVTTGLRTGFDADSTTYTQANKNLLGGDTTEALGVAGSATVANINMYVKGVAARKVTLQAAIGGTNGGIFSIHMKPDSGSDVAEMFRLSETGALKLAAYTAATFVAGDKYLVVDAAGVVHRSALGPAS